VPYDLNGDYMHEAAAALFEAKQRVKMAPFEQRPDLLLRIGWGFACLAAIERLSPLWPPGAEPGAGPCKTT
jgi:hypothetical protein